MRVEVNQLSGPIPPELADLLNLELLLLGNNQLSGSIPPELANLLNLEILRLRDNQLSGTIPPQLGNLSKLFSLYLDENQLAGSIPPELGNLLRLRNLWLDKNQLSGSIPPELGNILRLHELHLSGNQLSGPVPSFIADFMYLRSLDLSHNRFTFDGMELIAQTFRFAKYDWQMPVPLHVNGNTLSVSAGGTLSNNTYVWYQRDKPGNITIIGDSVFHPTESGTYFVKVRNKTAPDLKLASRAVKYTAPSSADAIALNKQAEILYNSFSVYPNPAKDVLHVTTNGNASFSLISEDGKTLLTSNVNKTGTINIRDLAAGVYYLRNNNTKASKKVSVTK